MTDRKWHSQEYAECVRQAMDTGQRTAARAIAALAFRKFPNDARVQKLIGDIIGESEMKAVYDWHKKHADLAQRQASRERYVDLLEAKFDRAVERIRELEAENDLLKAIELIEG